MCPPKEEMGMTTTILETRNEAWGFFATIGHVANPADAWDAAFIALRDATMADDEGIRDFLDSRHGRHFADTVADALCGGQLLPQAIAGAIDTWMKWKIDRKTEREHGIPKGVPYLWGWINHFAILAELEEA